MATACLAGGGRGGVQRSGAQCTWVGVLLGVRRVPYVSRFPQIPRQHGLWRVWQLGWLVLLLPVITRLLRARRPPSSCTQSFSCLFLPFLVARQADRAIRKV